jgi:hypothetical protein
MTKIAVLNIRREIVGYAETATEARAMLNPVTEIAGAPLRGIERAKLADDDARHPALVCFRPRYGIV